jgi:hypothetical protein
MARSEENRLKRERKFIRVHFGKGKYIGFRYREILPNGSTAAAPPTASLWL